MKNALNLANENVTKNLFDALIEIPKGCKAKYEVDKATGMLRLDRVLYTSTVYPANYGYIPNTLADDGDPLDVLVLCGDAIYPMTLVKCRPIGVINMIDGGLNDEKVIAVPVNDPTYCSYRDIKELPAHIYQEMMHFFEVYKALEYKQTTVHEVLPRAAAEEIIEKCIENYEKTV